jgi:hypothetical protein
MPQKEKISLVKSKVFNERKKYRQRHQNMFAAV